MSTCIVVDISISAESIDKLLNGLNPHKAAGPDKFKHFVLQTLHEELHPNSTADFPKILEYWKTPRCLERGKCVPHLKKGQSRLL